MKITISEFCKRCGITGSPVYRKIKRKQDILNGHINFIQGKMYLDEYAVEILTPKSVREKEREQEIEELRNRLESVTQENKSLERRSNDAWHSLNEKLSDKMSALAESEKLRSEEKKENAHLQSQLAEQNAEIEDLKKLLEEKSSELENERSKDLSNKLRGIFSKK